MSKWCDTQSEIRFTVAGVPKAKGRPRFNGKFAYTPKDTVQFENWVRLCFVGEAGTEWKLIPKGVAISAVICAFFPIPKSWSKKKIEQAQNSLIPCIKRPDGDNLAKSILDSLNGVAFHDDSQVTPLLVSKVYGDEPRTEVVLRWEET